jgi:hypothetical protein
VRHIICLTTFAFALAPAVHGQAIGFEDLTVPAAGYYNGSDGAGGFTSGGANFNNSYDTTYGTWSGWSYSRITNVTTPGYTNQYAAYNLPSGSGDNSATYGVAYNFSLGDATVQLPAGARPQSARITNSTYAALSMLDGDSFARQFSIANQDYFRLTIEGFDALGALTGSVDFYLADYRFPTAAQAYVVSHWTTVDLAPLGNAHSLEFALASSDNGQFGMNTPAYFALDNLMLTPVPEPGTLVLVAIGGIGLATRCCRRGPGRRSWAA